MSWKIVAACVALTLSACSSTGTTGTGSALQAFSSTSGDAGRPLAATIVDAMAGGLIGGDLGRGLDNRNRREALEAEYRALEYTQAGQPVAWGDGRRRGQVIAGSPYRVGSQDCRQYTHTVENGSDSRSARGTACRNADGSWTPLV